MPRARKRGPGRPSLGRHGHTRVVSIKMSGVEYAAIETAVRRAGPPGTVSSWIREHALESLEFEAV